MELPEICPVCGSRETEYFTELEVATCLVCHTDWWENPAGGMYVYAPNHMKTKNETR